MLQQKTNIIFEINLQKYMKCKRKIDKQTISKLYWQVGGAYALYQEMKEMRDCDYKILQEILKLKKFHF